MKAQKQTEYIEFPILIWDYEEENYWQIGTISKETIKKLARLCSK